MTQEKAFDDFIRQTYGETVNIAGIEFDVPYAFKTLDPTAYAVAKAEWEEAQ